MSFIRPEVRALLWHWREAIGGAGLVLFALVWSLSSYGLLWYLSLVFLAVGLVLFVAGFQRGRFRGTGEGSGVVQVTERQVTYFGPLSGGAVALSDLSALGLDGQAKPAHWQLMSDSQAMLQIPVDAAGADALFDVFSTLPGLRTEHLLKVMKAEARVHSVIWRRADVQKRVQSLH